MCSWVPLSVRHGSRRRRATWTIKGWREALARRLAPWVDRSERRAPERPRWAVYRFACPHGCGSACELADHHRRDPATIDGGLCRTHATPRVFVERRWLYESQRAAA